MNAHLVKVLRGFAVMAFSLALVGCGSITGLEAATSFGCKAPDGVQCQSVTGTYYNAMGDSTRGQAPSPAPTLLPSATAPPPQPQVLSTALKTPVTAGPGASRSPLIPLRTPAQDLRLWVKAWEDSDGDLIGDSHVYVHIDGGRWMLDHVQRQTREAFAPVRPGVQQPRATGRADKD